MLCSNVGCKRPALHEAVAEQDVAKVQELMLRLDLIDINQ